MSNRIPLWEAVANYSQQVQSRLHIPVHNGAVDSMYSFDVTELPTTDDLFDPQGPIAHAQRLAARAYNAREAVFCTSGSTTALQAAVLACAYVAGSQTVVLPRHVHPSLINACIIGQITPRFAPCKVDATTGIILGVNEDKLKDMIKGQDWPVVIYNPGYYGISCPPIDVNDRIVIADEAHGAHWPFSEKLPQSWSEHGAAVCIAGVHKSGGGLTQASLIRIHKDVISAQHIRRMMRLIHTSSPSYPIMVSIDRARAWLETKRDQLTQTIEQSRSLMQAINAIPGLTCPLPELLAENTIHGYDPLRIVINTGQYDADWLYHELFNSYGVQMELHDGHNILAIVPLQGTDCQLLIGSLQQAVKDAPRRNEDTVRCLQVMVKLMTDDAELCCEPHTAFFSAKKAIPITDAAGKIAGECLSLYPPGVAITIPGQRISDQQTKLIEQLSSLGVRFAGAHDPRGLSILTI